MVNCRIKGLFLVALLASTSSWAQVQDRMGDWRWGPNLAYEAHAVAPVGSTYMPNPTLALRFDWLESLRDAEYGIRMGEMPLFLRLQGGAELSPFYGQITTALGIQAMPRVELRLVYQNLLYFGSNVEMAENGESSSQAISETWNGRYIFDEVYDDPVLDQVQSFGFWFDLDLSGRLTSGGLYSKYTLVDVKTKKDGRSFDYTRSIPIYSRDFLIEVGAWQRLPLSETMGLLAAGDYVTTGYIKNILGKYTKEPAQQLKIHLGPCVAWKKGARRFSLTAGWWSRTQEGTGNEPWQDKFLVGAHWWSSWDVGFSRD